MIDFYNAFISYRHAKLDSAIAEHLVRQLEHFHVPHNLKKKLRHQKITRIFRDKDELPITSDLTETITNALANAEYLIVICSTNTKESMWVKREIRTFLQTHTADKILTVLCNGEPEEVIPEELLSVEKEYLDAQGFLHRITVPIEPLSCDYRLPRSRADKEELPRLASALLGCSYDELLRRRRQYAIRRAAVIVAAAFVALAAFGSYLMYTNKKINESYMESLRSRSVYLANEATQLMDEDKRVDGIQLALAALPADEKDKKPITAQAVRAITETTGAYNTSSNLTYSAVWNYKTSQPVSSLKLSENEMYLAAIDKVGNVYCWNTSSHKLIFNKVAENVPIDFVFTGNENILITYKNRIEAYNIESGANIWNYDAPAGLLYAGDVVFSANAVYLDHGNGEVVRLSAIDGSIKDTYKIRSGIILDSIYDMAVSPDGKKIAYADSSFVFNEESKVHIYDTETGSDCSCFVDTKLIYELKFTDNDHLCVISSNGDLISSMSFSDEFTVIRTGSVNYHFFDCKMQLLWNTELEYTDVANAVNILYLPARNAVLCYAGNAAAIFDIETGTELNRYQTRSSIVDAGDWNNNSHPEFICTHGEYYIALGDEDDNRIAFMNISDNNVSEGKITETLYFVEPKGSDIIAYNNHFQDDEWEAVDSYGGFITGTNYQVCYADDDYLVIAATVTETSIVRVSIIDPEDGSLLNTTEIDDVVGLTNHFTVDRVEDDIYCFFGDYVYVIDPETGKMQTEDYTMTYKDFYSNGMVITCDAKDTELTVDILDIAGSKNKTLTLSGDEKIDQLEIRDVTYLEALDTVLIPVGSQIYAGRLSKSSLKKMDIPDGWISDRNHMLYTTVSEDGSKVLLTDGNTVLVTDDSLKNLYSFHCDGFSRIGAAFKDNILYIASDYYLEMYDSRTGNLISRYTMELHQGGFSYFTFDDRNGQLFIQTSEQISIFDMATWTEIANVENAYCYHQPTDRFFTFSFRTSSECTPGYFRHYSLEDLIEKAERYLDGQELDEATKTRYGL